MPSTKAALSNLFHPSRPSTSADEKRHLIGETSSVASWRSSSQDDARRQSSTPMRPKPNKEKISVPTLIMPPMRFSN
ncbi:hypothetical protein HRG_003661 [Hirsutella rhossiliensis]|uniref:Uncharacterized protein n=1 Tax=Hirsutella rhossiliensis TaxID=111463 RepID=A0A9P8SLB7_9HYPO|nr:uncharacterized protein HRG_03661 [Hirsutella rhossiliensis]KAH0965645.1 hypothetical protein HRG_03661 [Hirsutella rhossiliensis]